MSYIVNQYRVMDKLSFMVEILNFVLDKVDHCYYKLDDRHLYYNATNDKFIAYYEHHACKRVTFYRDRYGDARRANAKKSYNELFIERLMRYGWQVEQRVQPGMEPPQHEKFLLWTYILSETDPRFPHVRFNATRCRYTLISMQNTRVVEDSQGRFAKDKSSERKQSVMPEEATHFGDCVDKRIWTKYFTRLQGLNTSFVDSRV